MEAIIFDIKYYPPRKTAAISTPLACSVRVLDGLKKQFLKLLEVVVFLMAPVSRLSHELRNVHPDLQSCTPALGEISIFISSFQIESCIRHFSLKLVTFVNLGHCFWVRA